MKRILIVGAGFAGMHAALAAARLRDEQGVSPDTLEITVVAPEPRLVVRPRLYEPAPETMVAPLAELFAAVDIRYEQGRVDIIDSAGKSVTIGGADGRRRSLRYDRLVLAAGSLGAKPDIPGLAKYGFTVDQLDDAIALDHHLHALANRPSSAARDTAVVCGGGFTGIEVATELRSAYVLNYYTRITPDGRWHELSISTIDPGYTVRARKGFFAKRVNGRLERATEKP